MVVLILKKMSLFSLVVSLLSCYFLLFRIFFLKFKNHNYEGLVKIAE